MQCPKCGKVPISFAAYSVTGWKYFTCTSCSTKLKMKRFGNAFWRMLALGIVVLFLEGFLFKNLENSLGSSPALILFIVTVFFAVLVPLYLSWRHGQAEMLA